MKIGHPKRKLVFQPSIFRCYVSFRERIHFQRLQKHHNFKSQGSVSREAGSSITFRPYANRRLDWWITMTKKQYFKQQLKLIHRATGNFVGDSVGSHNIHLIHLTYVYLVFFPYPFPLTFAEDLPQSLGMIPGFISSLTS